MKLKKSHIANLYQDESTGVYYVRKYVSGHGELKQSTKQREISKAKVVMNQIIASWLGTSEKKGAGVLFQVLGDEVLNLKSTQAEKTYVDYETIYDKYLLPYFGDKGINEVGPLWPQYKAFQKKLKPWRKLKHDRKHLRFILGYAYDKGLIIGIPVLKLDRTDTVVQKGKPYSNTEYRKLRKAAPEAWKLKIDLGMTMGMRRNEMRLLRWDYIDFKQGMITIPGPVIKTSEDRTFAIDVNVLRELRSRRLKSQSPYVFANARDINRPESKTDKGWQRTKKALGITGKFHWTRHTAATRAIRAGNAPMLVQSSLGMSDQVMKRVYVHRSVEDLRAIPKSVRRSLKK